MFINMFIYVWASICCLTWAGEALGGPTLIGGGRLPAHAFDPTLDGHRRIISAPFSPRVFSVFFAVVQAPKNALRPNPIKNA